MKKLTLLVAAALMVTGSVFAQEKACCKKKDGKACEKDAKKTETKKEEVKQTK